MNLRNQKQSTPSQPANKTGQLAFIDTILRLLTRLQRFAWDFAGIFFLALALMTLLAILLPGLTSGLLAWWLGVLLIWLGWGSLWLVVALGLLGLWMLRRTGSSAPTKMNWVRILLLEGIAFLSMAFLAALGGVSLARADQGLDGGRVGWGLAEMLRLALELVGLSSPLWSSIFLGLLLAFFMAAVLGLFKPLVTWTRRGASLHSASAAGDMGASPVVSEAPLQGAGEAIPAKTDRKKRSILPPEFRKSFRLQPGEPAPTENLPARDERLPAMELLVNEQFNRPDEHNLNLTAGLIEKTFSEFGIPAKVVGFRIGPTVTQFAVEPGYVEKEKPGAEGDPNRQKVRVSQILALERDLTLALSAERLRIEAPVPGQAYIGIEVPNLRSSIVRLRPILETEAFHKVASPLTIALGRDVSGQPVVADLARMPHLLIAGTTGSGKSVCIAAITTCLVMNNTPQDLRLIMIDPKMVELVRFNGLPHLFGKVETDLERILGVLRWAVVEMDRRYKVLEASHSRNIETHNRKARRRKNEQPMPRIVLLIDELADLMMSSPDQTEHNLVRLAQMARATGIHLVIATQRPSTDVVTGLIKANFPARISFSVASSIDSRVILDIVGAESLLGRGDMLYLPPDASGAARLQGVMVSDQEVERVITYWQKVHPPAGPLAPTPWDEMLEQEQVLSDRDGLVEKAIAVVRESRHASASLLQRLLHVGYPRAARLIDELEELGVVGPPVSGGREREVLIDAEEQSEEDF
jgi:S-DNA-T family DNA segregation ATPase FtsK/SpoIIIE